MSVWINQTDTISKSRFGKFCKASDRQNYMASRSALK